MKRRTSTLSPASHRLLGMMRDLRFGSIEGLAIRDGEPTLVPPPRVTRTVKLDRGRAVCRASESQEFALKAQHENLFDEFCRMKDGTIARIDVQDGLPVCIRLEETTA